MGEASRNNLARFQPKWIPVLWFENARIQYIRPLADGKPLHTSAKSGLGRAWLLALALGACLAGQAAAQPQSGRNDPFNGRLGVLELAPPPAEAARQAAALGEALAALAPQRPGQQDVYVIAASLWGDPVFEREATNSAAILTEHFGAGGRAIVLSAGGQGPRTLPPATPNSLSAAIGRVGALIDPEEDLVVLFVTSHGTPDGSAVFREANRMSGALRPAHLRDVLAQAGVRNRVVIVSACFSGAFIAPLMDDRTIVLTAATHDRTSFGCQPENDWTFFGDALFNQNLRNGGSILAAFDRAKVLIGQWERERNLTPPSNPQRFVGPRAEQMVQQAERRSAR